MFRRSSYQPALVNKTPVVIELPKRADAGKRDSVTISAADRLVGQDRAALAAAKKPSEIVVFPDAQHGFLADYRPSYSEQDAKAGWAKCLAWFREHGVG